MITKRLFSNLMGTGMRLTILASMVMMALGSTLPAAAAPSSRPQADTISIELHAVAGLTSLPGLATPVTVWGYTTDGSLVDKPGGPVLGMDTPIITAGDTVNITFYNDLPITINEPTALLFQGQSMVPDLEGIYPGESKVYSFIADKPGTFLYEAGLLPNAQHQVAMGLYGALIVRPTGYDELAPSAYGTAFDTEQVLVLSELDTTLNSSADPAAFDIRNYSPKYYLINGVAFPDTAAITAAASDTVLLRYVNAGLQAHSMSTLGLSQTMIANDGNALIFSHKMVAESIPTGQTMDTLVSIPVGAVDGAQYPLYDASLFLRNNNGNGPFAGLGGMMTMIQVGATPVPGDTAGPTASALGISPNPSDRSTAVMVTATISDTESNIDYAEFYIDTLSTTPIAMTADDGTFDALSEDVTGSISTALLDTLATGDHDIYVRGRDAAGNWGPTIMDTLTIVDGPSGSNGLIHFSTSGNSLPDPESGISESDFGDIYYYDGSAISLAFNDFQGMNVDGFAPVEGSTTDFYISFAETLSLTGIGAVENEDVVIYHSSTGTWEAYFDGTGTVDSTTDESDTNIDAISVADGILYFSTSDATVPTGLTGPGDDADIYSWNGSAFTREFDATAEGWSGNNVDGLIFNSRTDFYLSYSPTSTPVAGLGIVQDEDVVHFDGTSWSIYFDGTAEGLTNFSLDVDAFNAP